ncbi:unnamed protein product, partial [Discosporangium mesarthrocarpum]
APFPFLSFPFLLVSPSLTFLYFPSPPRTFFHQSLLPSLPCTVAPCLPHIFPSHVAHPPRFFINIKEDAGWADGRYVAYGRVSEGMDVVKKIDQSRVEGGSNKPSKPIVVVDCGLLPM